MSTPWMPFYLGDYLKKTGHLTTLQHGAYMLMIMHCWEHGTLPDTDEGRAVIARVSLKEWRAMRAVVEAFFLPDGSHERVNEERVKTAQKQMQRAIAGRKGGLKSGLSRVIAQANAEANAKQKGSNCLSKLSSKTPSKIEAETKRPRTNHISKNITTTFSEAAREEGEQTNTATSLATALPAGALARSPAPNWKPPNETTRAELDALIESRRAKNGTH